MRVADNLTSADLVLIVEGPDDVESLTALLGHNSLHLRKMLAEGVLALDSLHGASNLSYKCSLLRDQLCKVHVFLDHDAAGKSAFKAASIAGLVGQADVTHAIALGMKESELEDLYDQGFYAPIVKRKWSVDLSLGAFSKRTKKFSERLKDSFLAAGKMWDDQTAMDVKNSIASLVAANPATALKSEFRTPFDALLGELESKLS